MDAPSTTPHDAVFKQFLMHAETARDFLDIHLPAELRELCDLDTLHLESGSFIEESLKGHSTDVLYSVQMQGSTGYLHVVIEHQSKPDKKMAFRMMRYSIAAMHRHLEADHDKLPLVVPILFYQGEATPYPLSMCWFDMFYSPELEFFDFLLTEKTAKTANGCEAVCIFVNDDGSRPVLEELKKHGVKYIALRCAGFNNVDLDAAKELGLKVVRVPAYDPEAVAEHAIGMMMTLNRRIHRAYQRTRDANFSLEGLTGFTMYGKTAGVIGTGKIGVAMLRILKGFGMRLLAFDPYPSAAALELGVEYVDLPTLFSESDVISLHCPLTPENYHLLNEAAFDQMKNGVMIVNTSRGALIDSQAAIEALKNQKIGSLGMDVYENERDLFFEDKSNDVIQDDVFRRLSACHNVLFTGHQAFLTAEALTSISQTTLQNLSNLEKGETCPNELV